MQNEQCRCGAIEICDFVNSTHATGFQESKPKAKLDWLKPTAMQKQGKI